MPLCRHQVLIRVKWLKHLEFHCRAVKSNDVCTQSYRPHSAFKIPRHATCSDPFFLAVPQFPSLFLASGCLRSWYVQLERINLHMLVEFKWLLSLQVVVSMKIKSWLCNNEYQCTLWYVFWCKPYGRLIQSQWTEESNAALKLHTSSEKTLSLCWGETEHSSYCVLVG